jgi:hypothetical protein
MSTRKIRGLNFVGLAILGIALAQPSSGRSQFDQRADLPRIELQPASPTEVEGWVKTAQLGRTFYLDSEPQSRSELGVINAESREDSNGKWAVVVDLEDVWDQDAHNSELLAMLIDGQPVCFFPPPRDRGTSRLTIRGDFSEETALKFAQRFSPRVAMVYFLVVRADWVSHPQSEHIERELREVLKGEVVPTSLLDQLPGSGPQILFPTKMVSQYNADTFATFIAWLKARDLIVSIDSFPAAAPTTSGSRSLRTSYQKNREFLDLPFDERVFSKGEPQPFGTILDGTILDGTVTFDRERAGAIALEMFIEKTQTRTRTALWQGTYERAGDTLAIRWRYASTPAVIAAEYWEKKSS